VRPGDLEMLKNLQFAARVSDVQELIARPAAIQAAIDKHYRGRERAFFEIRETDVSRHQQVESQEQLMQQYDQRLVSSTAISLPPAFSGAPGPNFSDSPLAPASRPGKPAASRPSGLAGQRSSRPAVPSMLAKGTISSPAGVPSLLVPGKSSAIAMGAREYLSTLNALVSLIENSREGLRGHSALVARITHQLCERLDIQSHDADAISVAAYLHDLGKPTGYHLTALNVAESADHGQQARKVYLNPVRIFETARLPPITVRVLTHLYERFDGNGFPDRLSGKDIELGARLVAIAETHADLVGNPQNRRGRKLSPQESYDALNKLRGTAFDPALLDIFKTIVLGGDLRSKLMAPSYRALIIDPDPEETMMLEVQLIEQGFDVTIARRSAEPGDLLGSAEYDVVVSEVELQPFNGFELLKKLRASSHLDLPFVFVTTESGGDKVQKGFDLGANDYITKPASPELVALKIRQVLESTKRSKKARGVSGSLEEMGLPDVVQVLYHSRKSGKLVVTAGARRGEIFFTDGQICDASFGDKKHEEAFYEMLSLNSGHFELDPDFRTSACAIEMSPESLLLEGMRRLDEARR